MPPQKPCLLTGEGEACNSQWHSSPPGTGPVVLTAAGQLQHARPGPELLRHSQRLQATLVNYIGGSKSFRQDSGQHGTITENTQPGGTPLR